LPSVPSHRGPKPSLCRRWRMFLRPLQGALPSPPSRSPRPSSERPPRSPPRLPSPVLRSAAVNVLPARSAPWRRNWPLTRSKFPSPPRRSSLQKLWPSPPSPLPPDSVRPRKRSKAPRGLRIPLVPLAQTPVSPARRDAGPSMARPLVSRQLSEGPYFAEFGSATQKACFRIMMASRFDVENLSGKSGKPVTPVQ